MKKRSGGSIKGWFDKEFFFFDGTKQNEKSLNEIYGNFI